ncbi:MAG: hypothetical protein ACE5GZ_06130 [Gammaproteobacteria bacterium]
MKREHIDWTVIRGPLVTIIVCLSISGLLISGSFYFKNRMKKEFNLNNARFQSISRRYLAVDEEKKLVNNYYPEFINLYDRGIIGKERRLNWIEVLRNAGTAINLPSLSYEIKSQNVYNPAFSVNKGRYQLYKSNMSLNMQLLHEGDLFNLFEALDKQAKGAYSINTCKLSSNSDVINEDPGKANLNAKCDLEWFTIKLADGTELKV